MDISRYRANRREFEAARKHFHSVCPVCRVKEINCYCRFVQKFDPKMKFVILIHPIEVKRRFATGRMSHLSLQDSELFEGQDYSNDRRVNALVENSDLHCVCLYPGSQALNLSGISEIERLQIVPKEKKLVVFVIDGTWNTARKTIRSQNLQILPKICFQPTAPSKFRIRTQPAPECYSTIEAIHQTIELLGASQGFATEKREHDKLLSVFDQVVERQIAFSKQENSRHRRRKNSAA